jgi:alanyl-tRNA synthetase
MSINQAYVIADHVRASCFIIADGVRPSGKQRGYILRRLMRRAMAASLNLNIDITQKDYFIELIEAAIRPYAGVYNELSEQKSFIIDMFVEESTKYNKGIANGQKEWKKVFASSSKYSAQDLALKTWDLYQTHGVPLEVSEKELMSYGAEFDKEHLNGLIDAHQNLSQAQSKGQFKSGLGEDNSKTRKLHTVTHILHQQLREMFGDTVRQMGSAITSEKARFDFTLDRRLSDEEIETLNSHVQQILQHKLRMQSVEMSPEQAKTLGAIGLFGEKYGDTVTVYTLEDESGNIYSREFCGGPHIDDQAKIEGFTILKQKSIGSGLKRLEFTVN